MTEAAFNAKHEAAGTDPVPEWPDDRTQEEIEQGTRLVDDYRTHIKYYYLGWLLEAARFSLWDLNKTKAARGETPYNVQFRYMKIPQQSAFNAAFEEELNDGLVPDVDSFVAESITFMKSNCFPGFSGLTGADLEGGYNTTESQKSTIWEPVRIWGGNEKLRNALTMRPMTQYDLEEGWPAAIAKDKEIMAQPERTSISLSETQSESFVSGYPDRLDARLAFYGIIGDDLTGEPATIGKGLFAVGSDGRSKWDDLPDQGKKEKCNGGTWDNLTPAAGNWRHSLVIDPEHNNALRIMLPPYAGQLLYTYKFPLTLDGSGGVYPSWRHEQPNRILGDTLGSVFEGSTPGFGLDLLDERMPTSNNNYISLRYGGESAKGVVIWNYQHPMQYVTSEVEFARVLTYRVGSLEGGYGHTPRTLTKPGRYVGDPTESTEYGLLMPAINARYFSGDYVALQRRWYNRHIQYLNEKFGKVIRERIEEGIRSGKTIEDFAAEPVDLYRLTGRVYWPHSWRSVFRDPGEHKMPYEDTGNEVLTIFNESNPGLRLKHQEQMAAAIRVLVDDDGTPTNIEASSAEHSGFLHPSSNETKENLIVELQDHEDYVNDLIETEFDIYGLDNKSLPRIPVYPAASVSSYTIPSTAEDIDRLEITDQNIGGAGGHPGGH